MVSSAEQYALELANRFRLDPLNEIRINPYVSDLNAGLDPGTLSDLPRQPIAMDQDLTEAASGHSQWLLENDAFSYAGAGGSTPVERMTAAGYTFNGDPTWAENISYVAFTGFVDEAQVVNQVHASFVADAQRRATMMYDAWTEAGAGVVTRAGYPVPVEGGTEERTATMVTQDYVASPSTYFLTGVAYTDANGDAFYTPGEAEGGIAVDVARSGGSTVASLTTRTAGGYDQALGAGTYDITFSGGALTRAMTVTTTLADANIKVDVVGDGVIHAAQSLTLGANVISARLLGAVTGDIAGNGEDNVLIGSRAGNTLSGGAGGDTLIGGQGDDALIGGDGLDVAIYTGARADYTLSTSGGTTTVSHTAGNDGTDTLSGVEAVWFSDALVNLTGAAMAPLTQVAHRTVDRQEWLRLTDVSVSADPNGDAITAYQLWDASTGSDSAYIWTPAGGRAQAGAAIDIDPADLSDIWLRGGERAGVDEIRIRAADASGWGAWETLRLSTANAPPQITTQDFTVGAGKWRRVADLFTAEDVDGDPITRYSFWDGGNDARGAYLWTPQDGQVSAERIVVTDQASLDDLWLRGGSVGGQETLWMRAGNADTWGEWRQAVVTTQVNRAPEVAVSDQVMAPNTWARLTDVAAVTDADGDPVRRMQVYDDGAAADSGYIWRNGVGRLAARDTVTIEGDDLAGTWLRAGASTGSETMWVRAFDGAEWSAWKTFSLISNTKPQVGAGDVSRHAGDWARLSDTLSYSDADGEAATSYQFWDNDTGAGSGYLWTPGQGRLWSNQMTVDAANLDDVWLRASDVPGTETFSVRAHDGTSWGDWQSFRVTSSNQGPTVTSKDVSLGAGDWTRASAMIDSVSDSEGDAVTEYQFWDDGAEAGSGRFWTSNGGFRAADTGITVAADALSDLWWQGGQTGGSETVWVRANDGHSWGGWTDLRAATLVS